MTEDELNERTKVLICKEELISMNSQEKGEEDEDELRRRLMRVDDYSKHEIEEDMNSIDWELAYQEVIKIEEEKTIEKEKLTQIKIEEEQKRIEAELTAKYQKEKSKEIEAQQKQVNEFKQKMEALENERKKKEKEISQRLSEEEKEKDIYY